MVVSTPSPPNAATAWANAGPSPSRMKIVRALSHNGSASKHHRRAQRPVAGPLSCIPRVSAACRD